MKKLQWSISKYISRVLITSHYQAISSGKSMYNLNTIDVHVCNLLLM